MGHNYSAVGCRGCQELKLETLPAGQDLWEGLPQKGPLHFFDSITNEVVRASWPG